MLMGKWWSAGFEASLCSGFFQRVPPCLVGIEGEGVADAGHALDWALTVAHAVWHFAGVP